MLKLLNATAHYLHRFKPGLWLLLLGSIAGFLIIILFSEPASDLYAMLFALLCLWSLGLLMIVSFFPVELAEITPTDRFFGKLKKRLRYGFAWVIALITVLTSLAIIIITIRLLLVISRQ